MLDLLPSILPLGLGISSLFSKEQDLVKGLFLRLLARLILKVKSLKMSRAILLLLKLKHKLIIITFLNSC